MFPLQALIKRLNHPFWHRRIQWRKIVHAVILTYRWAIKTFINHIHAGQFSNSEGQHGNGHGISHRSVHHQDQWTGTNRWAIRGRWGGETHRWRIVDVDAEGVLGREAILGVRRPHFIASAGVDVKGPAAIGGRLRWHLVYLYGSGERRPAFLDRSSADGFVFLERNVASEREESGGQGETVSWARSRWQLYADDVDRCGDNKGKHHRYL